MANLKFIESYSNAVDQVFSGTFPFDELRSSPNKSMVSGVNGKILNVQTYSTSGMTDNDRDIISGTTRNYDNDINQYTLRRDRQWKTLVDPANIKATDMVGSVAQITKVMNTEQKIPEHAKYYSQALYNDWIDAGNTAITTTLTVDNILSTIDKIMVDMDEAVVPATGRILYITPTTNSLLKNAITRYKDANNESTKITTVVNRIDELTIKVVPSVYMKTSYDSTEGMTASPTALQVNFFIAHPIAVLPWDYYNDLYLDSPNALNSGKYVYFESEIYDIHILAKKMNCLAYHTTVAE